MLVKIGSQGEIQFFLFRTSFSDSSIFLDFSLKFSFFLRLFRFRRVPGEFPPLKSLCSTVFPFLFFSLFRCYEPSNLGAGHTVRH